MATAPKPAESAERRVVVATHGHCFDGLCSAVMFTRLLRHLEPRDSFQFSYHAAGYGPGQNGVEPKLLNGDVNAILDFRFSRAPQLTWYFDHHVSAFPSTDDRAAYEAAASLTKEPHARRMFHDGAYSSCTKLIADIGERTFGLSTAPMAELVRWADVIDSASFPSAKMAVERREPELQLMTVVEHLGADAFLQKNVPRLLERPLSEVARSEDVQKAYEPLKRTHEAFVELVRSHAREHGPVVYVDLADSVIEVAGKFVTYALYPDKPYSVILTRGKSKCKVSVGYNPWSPVSRTHNIAAICERYGGGGHAVVGAISLPAADSEGARRVAHEVLAELAT